MSDEEDNSYTLLKRQLETERKTWESMIKQQLAEEWKLRQAKEKAPLRKCRECDTELMSYEAERGICSPCRWLRQEESLNNKTLFRKLVCAVARNPRMKTPLAVTIFARELLERVLEKEQEL